MEKVALIETSKSSYVKIERLTYLRASQNWRFDEILLYYHEGLVAFHIPNGLFDSF